MPTVTIKILGTTPPCAKCKRAEQEALKVAAQFPGQVVVQKVDALSADAERYGMIVTPGTVVNDRLVATGRIVPPDQLIRYVKEALGG